jgi:hypothetical protein
MQPPKANPPAGYRYVFSAYITLRNGKRLYAASKGLKAFCFLVPE